jgi:(4-O-methyl)-D-glucuronate---lignin esterase
MSRCLLSSRLALALGGLAIAAVPLAAEDSAPAAAPTATTAPVPAPAPAVLPHTDAHGNALRRAIRTGHISNYDEAKVGAYTLPDPLVLNDGSPVRDAATWYHVRRPEILELYRKFIFGRVPAGAPRVTFALTKTDPAALGGTAVREEAVGTIGDGPKAPQVHVILYRPAQATAPVPVLLHIVFFGESPPPPGFGRPPAVAGAPGAPGPAGAAATAHRAAFREVGPIADILAHGYAYAIFRYSEFEPDVAWGAPKRAIGVRALSLAPGQTEFAADEWGTISAWAWGASRVLDYLETNPAVDAKRVALIGHSRLGKTVIWAGAQDPRFAIVYSSCGGELGTSLARRDFGETVDDMAQNFPWQFAGNLQQFPGHWDQMPVDTHMVIALNAPHPVFIGGGVGDQWSDPKGEFLGEVAAGPVYRLVGKTDLGTDQMPAPDHPLITGDLAFHYHSEAHVISASDWKAFLEFTDRYFKP